MHTCARARLCVFTVIKMDTYISIFLFPVKSCSCCIQDILSAENFRHHLLSRGSTWESFQSARRGPFLYACIWFMVSLYFWRGWRARPWCIEFLVPFLIHVLSYLQDLRFLAAGRLLSDFCQSCEKKNGDNMEMLNDCASFFPLISHEQEVILNKGIRRTFQNTTH